MRINTISDYKKWEHSKYHPLIYPIYKFTFKLRLDIIRELFGEQSPKNDVRFYRWMWSHKPHTCEEFMCPLQEYSAAHISHIITKGAHTEMRYDPRNINILSKKAHNMWEFSGDKRKAMNIWPENKLIIKILTNEYK